MSDKYDFGNLSPVEFEALCVDLLSAATSLQFESFAEGPDGGMDGRHSCANGDIILQAKHYKNSTWGDLQKAAKKESVNLHTLAPIEYYFTTSQGLNAARKAKIARCLNYSSVKEANIWGRTELNTRLREYEDVEKRHIKLWLSSAAVLERVLNNNISVFTEGTRDEIEKILKVYVANPSLNHAAKILKEKHSLIISGPPGVGKTTLAQVLVAEYCDDEWELIAITSIDDGLKAFKDGKKQVFIFDDFLGKIKLDERSLAKDDGKIARFFSMVGKRPDKRFILTSRAYILQAARSVSEAIDEKHIELTELVLDLSLYTREIKARILYNHLYHSEISEEAIQALLTEDTVPRIVDHKNYMPRIIEWMTDHYRNAHVSPTEYPQQFLSTLDNPSKIWDKAFNKHISPAARVLLYCMYFSKYEGFPSPGIPASNLKAFFDRAAINIGLLAQPELGDSLFEETLREIKSSFIVIDASLIKFINPSVQDFLSLAVDNSRMLDTLAASVPSWQSAEILWSTVEKQLTKNETVKVSVAGNLLRVVRSGELSGHARFHDLVSLVGNLILATDDSEFVQYLRSVGLSSSYGLYEAELPSLIEDLSEGKFSHLPYAPAYARLLRKTLYKYLSEREYVLEIDDLGALANNLETCFYEFSDGFYEAFDDAAAEAIDCLDPSSLREQDHADSTVSEWMENIEKIESFRPHSFEYSKKTELEEFLYQFEWHAEQEMQRYKDDRSLQRSSSGGKSISAPREGLGIESGFSNNALSAMFSSLKKQ